MLKTALNFIHLNTKQFATTLIAGIAFYLFPSIPEAAFRTEYSLAVYHFCLFFTFIISTSALLVELFDFLYHKFMMYQIDLKDRRVAITRLSLLTKYEKVTLANLLENKNRPTQLSPKSLNLRDLQYANVLIRVNHLGSSVYKLDDWVYKYIKRHPKLLEKK